MLLAGQVFQPRSIEKFLLVTLGFLLLAGNDAQYLSSLFPNLCITTVEFLLIDYYNFNNFGLIYLQPSFYSSSGL
jgi:hypothetical protein